MKPWFLLLPLICAAVLIWILVSGRFWFALGIFFAVSFALIALIGFFLEKPESRGQRRRQRRARKSPHQ